MKKAAEAKKDEERLDPIKKAYEAWGDKRVTRSSKVLWDAAFVDLVKKNSPNTKLDEYLVFINSEIFQTTMSVSNLADFIYEWKVPWNINSPSNLNKAILRNTLAKYLTGSYDQIKSQKEIFFKENFSDKTKMLAEVL